MKKIIIIPLCPPILLPCHLGLQATSHRPKAREERKASTLGTCASPRLPTRHLCSPVSIWTMVVAAWESSRRWSGAIFLAEKQSSTTEDCSLQMSACDRDGPATGAAKYIRGEGAIPTRKLKYALSWTGAPRSLRTLRGVTARIRSPR